ncbi:MAG: response regulator [Planctomycetaceae bacterium]|jgi:DNA-binding NtrC family response regulator|nr:response regulator [Planctomycetaceae bacterium]
MSEQAYTVLILDDDEAVRESFRDYFEDLGWQVWVAPTAEEAFDLLERQTLDAAVVDIRLPGMDGNAWLRAVREVHPRLACVVCTGSPEYRQPTDITVSPQVSERVFFKPVPDLDELAETLRRQIEQLSRHHRDELGRRKPARPSDRTVQREGTSP